MNKKQAISEPKFWKIFGARFLILLIIFSMTAMVIFALLDDHVTNERYQNLDQIRNSIEQDVKDLCEKDPQSEEYRLYTDHLRMHLGAYQSNLPSYAEVNIGDKQFATDKDFCIIWLFDGNAYNDIYYLEDMSYLNPVNEYMGGKFNYREYTKSVSKTAFDPIALPLMELEAELKGQNVFSNWNLYYNTKTIYINRETRTFLPGIIEIEYYDELYEVDCTPADTNGYELVEENTVLYPFYRFDPNSSLDRSHSFVMYTPDNYMAGITRDEYEYEYKGKEPWSIIFTENDTPSVFVLAPVSSAIIIGFDLFLSLVIGLILAFAKYQREKTIWNIFLYRTKTTEAMAHDLKTPLAAILAYAENIESSADNPDKTREYSKNICDKVASMDHMISDILALSKSESGTVKITSEQVSVQSLLKESLNAFPDMKTAINGEDVTLKTDKKLLGQAIDNLLSNCDRYGEEGGRIDIVITPAQLTIMNKTSMIYDDTEALKKPFVKGDDTRGNKGTGLGLSIAENNLNILGYKLELVSEAGTFKAVIKFKP